MLGLPPIEARLRLPATHLMYQVCRVQKLDRTELAHFDEHFIDHLFDMVEITRNQQDESLNYAVIKLILALNEQFMVSTLPRKEKEKSHTHPPIVINGETVATGSSPVPATSRLHPSLHPERDGERQRSSSVSGNANGKNHNRAHTNDGSKLGINAHEQSEEVKKANRVLMVLMRRLGNSKTFGENIIFMLNRARKSVLRLVRPFKDKNCRYSVEIDSEGGLVWKTADTPLRTS